VRCVKRRFYSARGACKGIANTCPMQGIQCRGGIKRYTAEQCAPENTHSQLRECQRTRLVPAARVLTRGGGCVLIPALLHHNERARGWWGSLPCVHGHARVRCHVCCSGKVKRVSCIICDAVSAAWVPSRDEHSTELIVSARGEGVREGGIERKLPQKPCTTATRGRINTRK
jgi:hypothetical protein